MKVAKPVVVKSIQLVAVVAAGLSMAHPALADIRESERTSRNSDVLKQSPVTVGRAPKTEETNDRPSKTEPTKNSQPSKKEQAKKTTPVAPKAEPSTPTPQAASANSNVSVSGYVLNSSFNVRGEPDANSQGYGTLAKYNWQALKVEDVPGKPNWIKIISPSGAYGYVSRKALTQVELNGTYMIRDNPSLMGTKVSSIREASSSNLILSGKSKVVSENGKSVEWLEVWHQGQKGWIASNARSKIGASPEAASAKDAPNAPDKVAEKTPEKDKPKPAYQGECVNTRDQFVANDRLKKAYGGGSELFGTWPGSMGIQLEYRKGKWIAKVPAELVSMATMMKPDAGIKEENPIALKICADKAGKPYVEFNKTKYKFTDDTARELDVKYGDFELKFSRPAVR